MKMIRAFIALEVPWEVKQSLRSLQDELRQFPNQRITWVRSEGIHMTLKFLGDIKPDEVDIVERCISEAAAAHDPIQLKLSRTGAFPNFKKPRILWVGLDGGEQLIRLQKEIDRNLTDEGFEPERKRYHPHLTLGRVKQFSAGTGLISHLKNCRLAELNWQAAGVNIMSSTLKPTGAEYKSLRICEFMQ